MTGFDQALLRRNALLLLRGTSMAISSIRGLSTWVGLLLLSVFVINVAHALPDGITKVTTVEGITEYSMPNGLQVLLFPDQSQPTITVNVTYRVGSRHEGRGEAGMAHLLEHMVFKGTPIYPNIWGCSRITALRLTERPGSIEPTTTKRCLRRTTILTSL